MGYKKLIISLFLIAITLLIPSVFAAVPDNDTVNITLQIKSQPNITSIVLNDDNWDGLDNEMDLIASQNRTIMCNITIFDFDNVSDINFNAFNATIKYHNFTLADDVKYKQTFNWSDCSNTSIDSQTVNVQCAFDAPYFAEPGNWTCRAYVEDNYNLNDYDHDEANITDLVALNISRDVIDFGGLGLGENSTDESYNFSVQNIGNVEIDVAVNSYGSTLNDGLAMNCTENNMTKTSLRYSQVNGAFNTYTALNAAAATFSNIDINLAEQDNFATLATDVLYWGVEAFAVDNPKGTCNGFIFVDAVQS